MARLNDADRQRAVDLFARVDEIDVETFAPSAQNFIESVQAQFEARDWLSEAQLDRLEEIVDAYDSRTRRR